MSKKKFVFVLTLCLTVMAAHWAFAQSCPDVVGDWDFTVDKVNYDSDTTSFNYVTLNGIFHILDQSDCRFYGYREIEGMDDAPITGVISSPKSIAWTIPDATFEGLLRGYDPVRSIYTKIKYTILHPNGAGIGLASRR